MTGTAAQAQLLAGWLRSRLGRDVALEHEPADQLEGVEIDGKAGAVPARRPAAARPTCSPSELDRFERDRIYEEAVRSAARR